jgi:hypothetical protein
MAHGSLVGNATITNNALQLTGNSGDYVNLPGGLVSGSSALTVEFWATFGANGNGAPVFDFGNMNGSSGLNFASYSPHTSLGGQRLGISTAAATVNFDTPGMLDNQTVHVVCVMDPTNNYCAIYTNGVLQSTLTTALPALSGISTAWSFIGRSMFSSDAWLNATIDELRVYDGRLTPQEIAVNDQYGPDTLALPIMLLQSNFVSGLTLSWPSWAVGFVPQSTTNPAGGVWTTLLQTPTLAGNQWSLPVPPTNSLSFYRLQR